MLRAAWKALQVWEEGSLCRPQCSRPRPFAPRLLEAYRLHPQHTQPPVSLRGQLLWREFFYTGACARAGARACVCTMGTRARVHRSRLLQRHMGTPPTLRQQHAVCAVCVCVPPRAVGAHTPNFSAMAGNPICRQIAWDHNPELLKAWREGATGFPWIDAAMAQLKQWVGAGGGVRGRVAGWARLVTTQ